MSQPQRGHALHVVESSVWGLVVLAALLTLGSTLLATFPARGRALLGEIVVLTAALALMALAVRRTYQQKPATGGQVVLVVARLFVGLPLLLFALVAAAAGFAA